jgi:GNAT superfamily N-acetyltransferase
MLAIASTHQMTSNHQEQIVVPVTLRDGSIAEIRPIGPADQGLLIEGLAQMSSQSKFARFGSGISGLSAAELRYLTDVNQVSHVAWGATIDGEPAGVGRYIVDSAAEAEIAITVVDRFQRRGLGRTLFNALAASARAAGIESFHFAIEPWNRTVLRMLPGIDVGHDESEDMLTGRIALADVPASAHDGELVRLLDRCRQTWPEPG